MITVQAQNRRFWLVSAEGGLMRLFLVLLAGLGLIGLGILFYQNAVTTGIFGVCTLIILVWLIQKPQQLTVTLDTKGIKVGSKNYLYSELDSWSLIDLAETAQLIIKPQTSSSNIELYIQKETLADSGIINFLTEELTFDPELSNNNPLFVFFRVLNLY